MSAISREPSSDDRAKDSREHENADSAAEGDTDEEAAVAIDFTAHGWTHELPEHNARVERKREATNRWWQERILIGLIASISDLICLSIVRWYDFDLNTDIAVHFHLTLVVLGAHGNKETISIFLPFVRLFTFL